MKDEVSLFTFCCFIFYIIFNFSIAGLVFLLPKVKDFLPPLSEETAGSKSQSFFSVVLISIFSLSFFCGFYSLVSFGINFLNSTSIQNLNLSDWRIGGLIFGALFILDKLINLSDSSTLDKLKKIYLSVLLKDVEPQVGLNQMRVELEGQTFKEHFHENIYKRINAHLTRYEKALLTVKTSIEPLRQALELNKTNPNQQQAKLVEQKTLEFCAELQKVKIILENMKIEATKISNLVNYYRFLKFLRPDENVAPEITKETTRIDKIGQEIKESFDRDIAPELRKEISNKEIVISEENRKILFGEKSAPK